MKDYSFQKYDSKNRWLSYWYQIKAVLDLQPASVLEVGVGNRTVSNYLKNIGLQVTTLDIETSLRLDIVADVLNMPLQDSSFDVILCAEVLEHLPFESFEKALVELQRVSRKYVVLSLPHFGHSLKFSFKIPFIKEKQMAVRFPFPIKHQKNGEHYWEIGKKGYSPSRIRQIINKFFIIKRDFIPFENQYHHFYILEKK